MNEDTSSPSDCDGQSFDLAGDGALEHLISAAQKHGEDSDPDHEVGDLQDLLRSMWGRLSEDQRRDFLHDDAVVEVLESSMLGADLPYVHGNWNHLFGSGSKETTVRLVFDTQESRIVAMQITGWPYSQDASLAEILDVQDSLKNANPEALEQPGDYGLARAYVLPAWAVPLVQVDQPRREIQRG